MYRGISNGGSCTENSTSRNSTPTDVIVWYSWRGEEDRGGKGESDSAPGLVTG